MVTCCALLYVPVGTEIDGVATIIAAGAAADEPPDPQATMNTESVAAMTKPNGGNGNMLGDCTYTLSIGFFGRKEENIPSTLICFVRWYHFQKQ
jgi:hypothetical protein